MAFEIHLMAPPGLESVLADEARAAGFPDPRPVRGGVVISGDWPEVWRANLQLRGAGRVSAEIAAFRAHHPAQLDKRARRVDWAAVLRPDVPVRVEATADRRSKVYHAGAVRDRIARAVSETLGAPLAEDAPVTLRARVADDLVTIAVDTSGAPLHKRGHKQAVARAPMRETMAALILRACGYDGREPVLDPMCGSGTFVLEAAEIAAGLPPGRTRGFAFEQLATFDPAAWEAMRTAIAPRPTDLRFHGSDRDAGAFVAARANAERAGVADLCDFQRRTVSEIAPPEGPPGLVVVNPPYGTRVGDRKPLHALHGALGRALRERFAGWRVGLVTSEVGLARAAGLPFAHESAPIAHGGLRVRLYRTDPL
jgi:putative N6-adenine-specific DNA methylase